MKCAGCTEKAIRLEALEMIGIHLDMKLKKYRRAIRVAREFIDKAQSCHAEEAGLAIAKILEGDDDVHE